MYLMPARGSYRRKKDGVIVEVHRLHRLILDRHGRHPRGDVVARAAGELLAQVRTSDGRRHRPSQGGVVPCPST
jgi:hypothetical protein